MVPCLASIPRARGVRSLLLVCAMGIPAAAAGADAAYTGWRPVTESDWSWGEDDSLGIRHAVLLYDGTIIDDRGPLDATDCTYSRYVRMRVLDASGLDAARGSQFVFGKEMRIRDIRARTVKRDGRVIDVPKEEIFEKTVVSEGRRRLKARSFAFKGAEAGDILEVRMTATLPIGGIPMVPIRHRHYTVESEIVWYFRPLPNLDRITRTMVAEYLWRPTWLIQRIEGLKGATERLPDDRKTERLRIRYAGIPAIPDEDYMPAVMDLSAFFVCDYQYPELERKKPFWDRVADRWGESTLDFIKRDNGLENWLEPVLDKPRNFEPDLRAVYAKLQSEIRNCDEPDEAGRTIEDPECRSIADVLRRRAGTTLDLHYLFVGAMRKLGYPATIAWIPDRTEGQLIEEWQNPAQLTLSAVVVRAPNGFRWLFPGFRSAVYGSIPWMATDCRALLEDLGSFNGKRDFATFSLTPGAEADSNRIASTLDLVLDDSGALRGRLRGSWRCLSDPSFPSRLRAMGREEADEALAPRIVSSRADCERYEPVRTERLGGVEFACSLSVPGAVALAGDRMLVSLGTLVPDHYGLPKTERESQIHFRHPIRYETSVTVRIPEGWEVEGIPESRRRQEEYMVHQVRWSAEGRTVRFDREFTLLYERFIPEAAEELSGLFENLYAEIEVPVVLRRVQTGDAR